LRRVHARIIPRVTQQAVRVGGVLACASAPRLIWLRDILPARTREQEKRYEGTLTPADAI